MYEVTALFDLLKSPQLLASPLLLIAATAWALPWKGYALWLAARNNHPWWFIALLVINTLAILEIIYIFAIGRPTMKKQNRGI